MISVQADAKTKVSVGAGNVVGGTNAAAGIYANINYKRAPHQCCYHISGLQSSSMRFLKDKHQLLYKCISINPLYTCDSLMRTFSDSEYSDEMQHYEAFYQCLH